MSLKSIRCLYAQRGHLFYRDGLTFSKHSAQSFYYAKNFQKNNNLSGKESDILLVSSTFHNIGKMLDKNASIQFTSGIMQLKHFPVEISQTVYLQDLAKRYIVTYDKNLIIKSQYIHSEIVSLGWTLTSNEERYFKEQKNAKLAILLAENDIHGFMQKTDKLTDNNWNELEKAIENIFEN